MLIIYLTLVIKNHCFRGDNEIQPTFKLKMARDGELCTLQMTGMTLKMTGEYRCQAINSAGEATSSAVVTVVGE